MSYDKNIYIGYGINFLDGNHHKYMLPYDFYDIYPYKNMFSIDRQISIIYDCNGNTFFGKIIKDITDNEKFSNPIDVNIDDGWKYHFKEMAKLIGVGEIEDHDIQLQIITSFT